MREDRLAMGPPAGPARSAAPRDAVTIPRIADASKHARESGHPVIALAEPGERWLYCYSDDGFAEY